MSLPRDFQLPLKKKLPPRVDLTLQALKFCNSERPEADAAELQRAAEEYIATLPFGDDAGRPATARLACEALKAAEAPRHLVKQFAAALWPVLREAFKEPAPTWHQRVD